MKIRINVDVQDANSFVDRIIKKYHFEDKDKGDLIDVYHQIKQVISPSAEYRINQLTTGVDIIDKGTSAAVSMTLGYEIDDLQEQYEDENKLQEAYMIECIASELLLLMYGEFNKCYARFHRRYVSRYVFVGDAIPVDSMDKILKYIEGNRKEESRLYEGKDRICANEYGVLTPSKSVVFYALLSENPATKCRGICEGCNKADCENSHINDHSENNNDKSCKGNNINVFSVGKSQMNYGFKRIFGDNNKDITLSR